MDELVCDSFAKTTTKQGETFGAFVSMASAGVVDFQPSSTLSEVFSLGAFVFYQVFVFVSWFYLVFVFVIVFVFVFV